MSEALKLYRQSLKMLRVLPKSHSTIFKAKMAYNFREMMDIYRHIKDPERIAELIRDGHRDVETFREIFSLSPDILNKIFPLFDLTNNAAEKTDKWE